MQTNTQKIGIPFVYTQIYTENTYNLYIFHVMSE